MRQKWFPSVIALVGVLTILYQFVFFVQQTGKFLQMKDSGTLSLSLRSIPEQGRWIVGDVDNYLLLSSSAISKGDTIVAMTQANGDSLSYEDYEQGVFMPGEKLILQIQPKLAEANPRDVEVGFEDRSKQEIVFLSVLLIFRFLITLAFLALGMRTLAKHGDLPGARMLALFSFSVVAMMIAGVDMGLAKFSFFEIPGEDLLLAIQVGVFLSMGALWVNVQVLFPRPTKWIEQNFLLAHILIYLPQVFILLGVYSLITLPPGFVVTIFFLQIVFGFGVLFFRRAKTRDNLERRQLTLVAWGSSLGLGFLLLVMMISIIPLLNNLVSTEVSETLIMISFSGLLLLPVSFAFAFGGFGLLDLQGRLHRGTSHLLVTGLLLILFFSGIYFLSGLLLESLNLSGRGPVLMVALLMTLGFAPIHRRARDRFENKIYPERKRLRQILGEFLASTTTLPDRDGLWRQLETSLAAGLGISSILPCIFDEGNNVFLLPSGKSTPLKADSPIVKILRQNNRPQLVDELVASSEISLNPEEKAWLLDNDLVVLMPLALRSSFIGILGLTGGDQWRGLDVAGREELNALGSQVALEFESLRLLEVTLNNRRLEQELDMARQMQEGFLPSSLPETPGLKMAADLQSSLEVAGDYYDVLALPNGKTMIAVGDVSGKGAGAAMIMANLQASIRSMVRVEVPLKEMVDGINDILFTNTPSDKFVTFFVGFYDSNTNELEYVNAGHNPPRIIHEDASHTELLPGGPMLGAFPGIDFKRGNIAFKSGEVFIAFTDGVSEAMNDQDEFFGEERIVQVVAANTKNDPQQLINLVEEAVTGFRGDVPLGDDYTIVVASAWAS
ncbi:MAG: serine/threonine-protein phosphatase [bacterium]|nr:serine/threonine-protein phosphatase [bacterium]